MPAVASAGTSGAMTVGVGDPTLRANDDAADPVGVRTGAEAIADARTVGVGGTTALSRVVVEVEGPVEGEAGAEAMVSVLGAPPPASAKSSTSVVASGSTLGGPNDAVNAVSLADRIT